MPLCLLKGFDAGGLGLATVDLDSAWEEREEVDDPEPPKEKRDLDLWDCVLWIFAKEPLLGLMEELDQRLRAHPGVVLMAVEEDAVESRDEVRKRFIVPRVRISSVVKERTFRVGRIDFPLVSGVRVEAELSMEDVGVRECELETGEEGVDACLNGCRRFMARGFNHAVGGAVGADADFPTGGRAVVSRITGEEPTLDMGE